MSELARRWRLILGQDAQLHPQQSALLSEDDALRDSSLDYLYQREHQSRVGGQGDTAINAVKWLQQVRGVFPQSAVEILQKQAVDRYQLTELLTDKDTLQAATANLNLVQTLLSFRASLPADIMAEVRRIIEQVCAELEAVLSQKVNSHFSAKKCRHLHGGRPQLTNMDWSRSIKRNLKHYDPEAELLILERMMFYKNQQNALPWELFVVIDQSGSMLESLIHSAVLAAIFCRLKALNTHLILFDTSVVDLSEHADDPVENLLSVQLGGGTDIGGAMGYVNECITQPKRSMVVLISDFYEGGSEINLYQQTEKMHDSGVKMLGLAALNEDCNPEFDRDVADQLCQRGMHVSAMTPDHLVAWVAEAMK